MDLVIFSFFYKAMVLYIYYFFPSSDYNLSWTKVLQGTETGAISLCKDCHVYLQEALGCL